MKKINALIAKPGLDGHDKGAKIISLALQNSGINVIYSGLHQSINKIINKVEKHSINLIGLSIMTGSHLRICQEIIKIIKKKKIKNIKIIIGGIIPKEDEKKLINMGINAVFPNGSKVDFIIKSIKKIFKDEEKNGNR